MKLYALSSHPNRPCFILKFKGTTIMLDTGLDLSPLMSFLPMSLVPSGIFSRLSDWKPSDEKKSLPANLAKERNGQAFINSVPEFAVPKLSMLDLSEVDCILISNHHCMLALPYVTEFTNFNGVIYATEPTLHIGKLYMEEMVDYMEKSMQTATSNNWKQKHLHGCLPKALRNSMKTCSDWRQCYNTHDVHSALSKVQTVGFHEQQEIFGAVMVKAVSSGFCLGSSNWLIESQHEKICYISGSSTLTTHPKPIDQTSLRDSDLLIMTCLTQMPTANPDAMIREFCVNAAMTLRNGGNVLVPCYSSGVTYDLFECLSGHLDSCDLPNVPMYFISPVAKSSLAYSNIYSEWLSASKKNKVYLPEPPFPHAELVKNFRLQHYSSLHDGFTSEMKMPCVVFTGHPSLRLGNVVHFMELWAKSSCNTLIFTEPDFSYLDVLAPYQPLAMKVAYCPIDTSLSYAQANKLIRELKPRHLVVPAEYTSPPQSLPQRDDLVIEADPSPMVFRQTDVLSLPVKRSFERLELEPQLAAKLMPSEVRPGVSVAMVTGALIDKDNKLTLKRLEVAPPGVKKAKLAERAAEQPMYVWGNLDVYEFVDNLKKRGITDVKVEECSSGYIVHLPSEDSLIQIEDGSTHIICGNEALRIQIRDTLLRCLSRL